MGSYKTEQVKLTVAETLNCAEVEMLHGEMEEWSNNMDGSGLENTQKFEDVSACADTLECASDLEEALSTVREALEGGSLGSKELTYSLMVNKNRKRGPSRAVRLGNELTALRHGIEAAEEYFEEVTEAIEEIKGHLDELEGVDFPGMF